MRDVTSRELSCLLDYIYTGTADVAPSLVASFTKLAKDIGLKGFSVGAQSPDATSSRARLAKGPNRYSPRLVSFYRLHSVFIFY